MRALESSPSLAGLARLFRATHGEATRIYLSTAGLPEAGFRSDEGVHQGDALASAAFCAAIHDAVKELDAALAMWGGAARFDMDDGYAVGPPTAVFQAVSDFAQAVSAIGLELRVDKSSCFSFGVDLMTCEERPHNMPLGQLTAEDGRTGYGIAVGGVP
eukprot:9865946-Karenia_brevis.AAC.1